MTGICGEVLSIGKKITGICGEVLSIDKKITGICGEVLSITHENCAGHASMNA
jgi:hypothetical protein